MKRLPFILLLLVVAPARADNPVTYPPPAEVRAAFLKLLDRPKVPLDVRGEPGVGSGFALLEQLTFASEKKADGALPGMRLTGANSSAAAVAGQRSSTSAFGSPYSHRKQAPQSSE